MAVVSIKEKTVYGKNIVWSILSRPSPVDRSSLKLYANSWVSGQYFRFMSNSMFSVHNDCDKHIWKLICWLLFRNIDIK